MRTVLFKITNQGIYFNTNEYLSWEATNFPVGAFRFREREPIFWKVSMQEYDAAQACLTIEVEDYQAKVDDSFAEQQPKQPLIRLKFAPLDETTLKSQLTYYSTQLDRILAKPEVMPVFEASSIFATRPDEESPQPVLHRTSESTAARQRFSFEIAINDLQFGLGQIKGQHQLKEWDLVVDFFVQNNFIIPEFDHIKPFFSKALGTRKVRIQLVTEMKDVIAGPVLAHSPVLAGIDESFLEVVQRQRSQQFLSPPQFEAPNQGLFTEEELYQQYDEVPLDEQLHSSAEDILQHLLANNTVRNAKQLQYLAGKLQDSTQKIRFTLTPMFGFVFGHRGPGQQHFIWELINSHATYLWSAHPDQHTAAEQVRQLDQNLQFIREHGRRAYRDHHHADPIFQFHAITHRHAKSLLINGFPRWRNQLLELLN